MYTVQPGKLKRISSSLHELPNYRVSIRKRAILFECKRYVNIFWRLSNPAVSDRRETPLEQKDRFRMDTTLAKPKLSLKITCTVDLPRIVHYSTAVKFLMKYRGSLIVFLLLLVGDFSSLLLKTHPPSSLN